MIASREFIVSRNTAGMEGTIARRRELRFQAAKQMSEALRDVSLSCRVKQIVCVFDGELSGQVHVYYEAA